MIIFVIDILIASSDDESLLVLLVLLLLLLLVVLRSEGLCGNSWYGSRESCTKRKNKNRYLQSLLGPYESSNTKINVKIILFMPAAPFHGQFWNIWRIREICTKRKTKKLIFTITNVSIWSFTNRNKLQNNFLPGVPYYPKQISLLFFTYIFEVVKFYQGIVFSKKIIVASNLYLTIMILWNACRITPRSHHWKRWNIVFKKCLFCSKITLRDLFQKQQIIYWKIHLSLVWYKICKMFLARLKNLAWFLAQKVFFFCFPNFPSCLMLPRKKFPQKLIVAACN